MNRKTRKRKKPRSIDSLIHAIHHQLNEYGGDSLFNLLLVHYGARKAFFFDNTMDAERTKKTIELARSIGLHVKKDPTTSEENPGYWMYHTMNRLPTTSEETGQALGFLHPASDDSNFGNFRIRRVSLHIMEKTTSSYITSEVVTEEDIETIREFAKKKVAIFDQSMIDHQLPYRFKYEIDIDDGTIQRMKELQQGNTTYLLAHRKDYLNDLENIFDKSIHPLITLFKQMIHHPSIRKKYTPLFLYIYKMFNKWVVLSDDQFNTIYKKFIDTCT